MKPVVLVATLLLGALFCPGCSELLSLNEFIAEEEAVMDPALLGVWTHNDDTFAIAANGNAYTIRYFDKGPNAMRFDARMAKVGDAKLLDLVEVTDDAFVLPLHVLARVWTEGDTLHWTLLDSDWLKQETGRRFATHKDDKRQVLTVAGAEWRKAVWQLAADDKAYKGRETATKVQ